MRINPPILSSFPSYISRFGRRGVDTQPCRLGHLLLGSTGFGQSIRAAHALLENASSSCCLAHILWRPMLGHRLWRGGRGHVVYRKLPRHDAAALGQSRMPDARSKPPAKRWTRRSSHDRPAEPVAALLAGEQPVRSCIVPMTRRGRYSSAARWAAPNPRSAQAMRFHLIEDIHACSGAVSPRLGLRPAHVRRISRAAPMHRSRTDLAPPVIDTWGEGHVGINVAWHRVLRYRTQYSCGTTRRQWVQASNRSCGAGPADPACE